MPLFLQQSQSAPDYSEIGGYGASLLQAFFALIVVCIVAWVVLRLLSQRTITKQTSDAMKVIDRVGVGMKSSLVVVQVGKQRLLVGVSENQTPRLVSRLRTPIPEPKKESSPPTRSFKKTLDALNIVKKKDDAEEQLDDA